MSVTVAVRDVTHTYDSGATPALDGVTFTVPARSITTVLGPSGSGKSTLLAVIAGIETPAGGDVCFDDDPVTDVPAGRRGVAIVLQQPYLFPNLSVGDNVTFALAARGIPRRERVTEAERWLDRVGLAGMAGRRPRELSGGEQQRVALVRALAAAPKVLLLDEPLASLDPRVRETLQDLLRDIVTASGVTAIMVTHDRAEAMALGSRIVLLDRGRLIAEGPSQELFTRPPTRAAAVQMGVTTFLEGVASAGSFATDAGILTIDAPDASGSVTYAIRPEHVAVVREPGRNTIAGVVSDCTYRGEHWDVTADTPLGPIRARSEGPCAHGAPCLIHLAPGRLFVVDDPPNGTR